MSKQIQVGDLVKSLDFVGNDSCFLVGRVIAVNENDGTFTANGHSRYWDGNSDDRVPEQFTAPLQGNHFFDDPSKPRVIVITEVAA